MSWLFSQALVAEYSAGNFSDGERSVPLNSTPMPQAYLLRDKTTEAWNRFPSGMTCEPLTEDHGEALLTWYREDSLAKTSAAPEKVQELTAQNQVFGEKWRGLSVKYDPASSSWKTAPYSPTEGLTEFSGTWPRWGTMRDGVCSEQMPPQLIQVVKLLRSRTTETESGSLPTILDRAPTPTVNGNYNKRGLSKNSGDGLATWVSRKNQVLPIILDRLPTPTANDARNATFPPASHKWHSIPGELLRRGGEKIRENKGTLNPSWVEWLMGWPIGWTDLEPLETGKFQQWLRLHGKY